MSISRREFNRAAIGTGAVIALGQGTALAGQSPLISRPIPSSGEAIPIIGVGTNRYGVGSDAELRAPLKAALQTFHALGGTVIDTAPGYRSSEIVLGELMVDLGINDEMFVATKVDVEGRDACAERMQRSLSRFNSSSMELMQVHNFTGWEEALPVMQEWKDEGRLRYIGITTSRARQYELMEKVMNKFELDFIQINYSLASQRKAASRILPLAADQGTAVLVNRPFGGGGVFKQLTKTTIPEWAAGIGVSSWAQFLLKYVLSHPAVTCAIPGMTKQHHVVDNLDAARNEMPSTKERQQMESFFDNL